MPKEKESFALIFSVEDPGGRSPISGIGAQVMGPADGYLVQYDLDVSKFWAGKESLTLGSCFEMKKGKPQVRRMISKVTNHMLNFNNPFLILRKPLMILC